MIINLPLLDNAEAPVPVERVGERVAGKSEHHYAIIVELTYHF